MGVKRHHTLHTNVQNRCMVGSVQPWYVQAGFRPSCYVPALHLLAACFLIPESTVLKLEVLAHWSTLRTSADQHHFVLLVVPILLAHWQKNTKLKMSKAFVCASRSYDSCLWSKASEISLFFFYFLFFCKELSLITITITYASAYILTALLELEVLKDRLDEVLGAWSGEGNQPTARGLELGDL